MLATEHFILFLPDEVPKPKDKNIINLIVPLIVDIYIYITQSAFHKEYYSYFLIETANRALTALEMVNTNGPVNDIPEKLKYDYE